MLPVNIAEVAAEHISSLVNEKVTERRTLEYKERLPGGSDQDKKEFLADVCSFANLVGGDIIYGIRDERDGDGKPTGVPESVVDLAGANLSAERERLESIIRNGIQPRIPNVETAEIQMDNLGPVLLLRIARSWIKPHMVTFKETSRFYSRHSTGKYQLDVVEIGQAFAEQRSIGEQLRNWQNERVSLMLSGELPVDLTGPSRFLVHFVPAAALVGQQVADFWPAPNDVRNLLRPSSFSGAAWRYNADGFLVYGVEAGGACASYVQLFRNGCLEYADGHVLNLGGGESPELIPSEAFEEKLVRIFGNVLLTIRRLGVVDPIFCACTMVGVQGKRLSRGDLDFFDVRHTFDRQVINVPEVQIDRTEQAPYRDSLLPLVNSIWQANGYEQTPWGNMWGG